MFPADTRARIPGAPNLSTPSARQRRLPSARQTTNKDFYRVHKFYPTNLAPRREEYAIWRRDL